MDALEKIITSIMTFLDQNNPCTEHELLKNLIDTTVPPFDQLNIKQSKDLFNAHFLIMHALYQLQNRYFEERRYCLKIEAIKIERLSYISNKDGLAQHDPLKTYYLDINHYFKTSEEEVNGLLNSFWEKYLAQDDRQKALITLELPSDADYHSVKKQYRKLAQQHHPDKGGCNQYFAEISAAKDILEKLHH